MDFLCNDTVWVMLYINKKSNLNEGNIKNVVNAYQNNLPKDIQKFSSDREKELLEKLDSILKNR